MRNPRAHEAAAMVLGAFGLRDSAGDFSDTRWVLNRMTAHLAVATALRNGRSEPSIDGQIANATLLALVGRQRTSLSAVDALAADAPAVPSWQLHQKELPKDLPTEIEDLSTERLDRVMAPCDVLLS